MQLPKLSKKGNVANKTVNLVIGVIGVVVLISAAPYLWGVLNTALTNSNFTAIPFVGGMASILGLLFGVAILIGAIYGLTRLGTRR